MSHAQKDNNLTDFNTFKVFEDIYNKDEGSSRDLLDQPRLEKTRSPIWFWFSFILFITVFGLSVHPLLSYTLKTPYPLVVISEDTMQPSLASSDMVVIEGVVDKREIKVDDIIAYHPKGDETIVTIKRVEQINGNKLVVRGDATASATNSIYFDQVVGKIVGGEKPLKIPFIGKILLARK